MIANLNRRLNNTIFMIKYLIKRIELKSYLETEDDEFEVPVDSAVKILFGLH